MFIDFVLIHSNDVDRGYASFPAKNIPASMSKFVFVRAGDKKMVFRKKTRFGAGGNQVWISDQELINIPDKTSISVTPVDLRHYRFYRLIYDENKRIALYGLLIGVAGLIIKFSLDVGKYTPLIEVNNQAISFWIAISYLLNLLGLSLVFYKGAYLGLE